MERTQLHLAAAQTYQRAADLATAQFHSYEALRLLMQTSASILPQHGKSTGVSGGEGRGWRVVGLCTAALLQGARLCEALGSPEEALDGFKQACKLVRSSLCEAAVWCQVADVLMLASDAIS